VRRMARRKHWGPATLVAATVAGRTVPDLGVSRIPLPPPDGTTGVGRGPGPRRATRRSPPARHLGLTRRAAGSAGGPVASPSVDLDAAMGLALEEAAAALAHDDVPVGAVVLRDGEVIATRHNERERTGDPTAHAEVLAVRDAARTVGSWRLEGTTLVVTLEPCPMCAGALLAARIDRVVFGAADPKAGACGSLHNLCADPRLNHEVEVVPGVRAAEAAELLSEFFGRRRG
jgi:tRNA(adenine34) deaminase